MATWLGCHVTVFAVFAILSILGMMAIDFYVKEQMGDAAMVRPDAVGK